MSLDPASVPAKWHVNPSSGLSRVHECDVQTDNATYKIRNMGEVACIMAISLKGKVKGYVYLFMGNPSQRLITSTNHRAAI